MTNLTQIDLSKLRFANQLTGKIKEFITPEDLIQLAKDKKVPHYIITHPISNELQYCFNNEEINFWFTENFVKYQNHFYEQVLNITNFDYESTKRPSTLDVPLGLSKIKNLFEFELKDPINTPPCIYFLCHDKTVVYIGQSTNVYVRITTHISEKLKTFSSAYFIPCHINCLDSFEKSLIGFFKPKYNLTALSHFDKNHIEELFENN